MTITNPKLQNLLDKRNWDFILNPPYQYDKLIFPVYLVKQR